MLGRVALCPRAFFSLAAIAASLIVLAGFTVPDVAQATEAPIAAWSFDEGAGNVAHDLYGSHDGELEHAKWDARPEWTNGKFGDALRFQGQGYQCVNVPQAPDLELQGSFTIETWVKPEGTGEEEPLIFKEAPTFESHMAYMLYLGLESNGKVGGYVEEAGWKKPEVTSEKLPVGKWTHLALTFDGEHLRLYVNGELADTTAAEGPQASKGPLKFGCSEVYGQDFEGRLDEVRIYDRAISEEEVERDMSAALQTPPPSQGPVAEYSFDEAEGATAADLTGAGRAAIIEGATRTPHGRYGGALQFDGENDSVSIPASPGLDVEEEFTLEAWVRSEGANNWAPVISKEKGSGKVQPWYLYAGSWKSNLPFGGLEGEAPGEVDTYAGDQIPEDTWTHLAFTFDGAKTRLYVNGELVGEEAGSAPCVVNGRIEIGADQNENFFKGRIDEVRIYNRSLSAGEVAADMEAPIQTPKQTPVADWSFDSEAEPGVDLSTGGNTATIEGATWTPHGRYGGALQFEGSEDCVKVTDGPQFQMDEELTLEAWVRPTSSGEFEPIFYKQDGETGYGYALWAETAEGHGPTGEVNDGTYPEPWIDAKARLPEGVWSHVALTFDGGVMRLYVDGEEVDHGKSAAPIASEGPLEIGCAYDYGYEHHFQGRIDEPKVYERALSPAEVAADMEAPIQTPKQTPVADWSFDSEAEPGVDLSTGGNTATIEGATWTPHGRYGGALQFEGSEDCVKVTDGPQFQMDEEMTLEAWVRPTSSGEFEPIFYKQDGETGYGYALWAETAEGHGPTGEVDDGTYPEPWIDAKARLPEGVWSHVALTFDGGMMRLFVDGEEVDHGKSAAPIASEGPLEIGCAYDYGYAHHFQGRIDEPRVYERALSPAEVAADMEAPIQTPKQGPVAAYSFDEGEGSVARDATGHGHEGSVEGATWTKGEFGGALRFVQNEGTQCVSIADDPSLRFEEEFTVEAWVRPEVFLGTAPIVSKEFESGVDQSYSLGIGFTKYGKVEGWSENSVVYSPHSIEEDKWVHIAYTYDGDHAKIYLNGELASDKAVGPRDLASSGPLRIGCNSPELGGQFFGRIDDVRLYDRAITEAEVDTDKETPIQTPKQAPVAAYSFNEGQGESVEDKTGNGHTATIHGADWATQGRYGGAMEFDAAKESYLSVPDSPQLDFDEAFTLEAWIRPGADNPEWAPIITKQTTGSRVQPYFLYEGSNHKDIPYGGTQANTKEEESYAQAEDALPAQAWSHLALTYEGDSVRIYVDGKLVDENYACPPVSTEGDLEIGGASEVASYFSGRIDDVRIWNRALDPTEIEASLGLLPFAETEEAYGVEEVNAVFAAKIDPQGLTTNFRFQYGTTEAYGQTAPEAGTPNEQPEFADEMVGVEEWVTGLEPETTYHYRVVATNANGTVVGQDQTLTTEAEPAEPRPFLTKKEEEEKEEKKKEREQKKKEREKHQEETWAGPIGLNWSGDLSEPVQIAERLHAAGATMFRVPISTPDENEKTEKQIEEEYAPLDNLFLSLAKEGITMLPDPTGFENSPEGERNYLFPIPPGSPTRMSWEHEIEKLLQHYGPGGSLWQKPENTQYAKYAPVWWEIWNEPNYATQGTPPSPKYPHGSVSAKRYGELLEVTHAVFTKTNPAAKVLFGGLLNVGKYERPKPGDTKKQRREKEQQIPHTRVGAFIAAVGHPEDYEGLSLHPYAFTGSDTERSPTSQEVPQVTAKVEKAIGIARGALDKVTHTGETKKPIWITEIGWPVKGHGAEEDGNHRLVGQKVQKELLNSSFNMIKSHWGSAKSEFDITNLLYYNLEDNNRVAAKPTLKEVQGAIRWDNHCGLLEHAGGWENEAGHMREAWSAFKHQTE
jgi:hypothetical protein